jgi:hypothetical protein
MSNKIYTPHGVLLAINGSNIGNIASFTWTAPKWELEDVTNLGSPVQGPGYVKEMLPTVNTPGDFKASVYYVPTDAGLAAVGAAFANASLASFSVQLGPDLSGNTQTTVGDSWTWYGYITDMPVPDAVNPTKPLTYTVSCTMNTIPVKTQGS